MVSSRQLSLNHGEVSQEDPNLQLLIMPLLDFINHAPTTETQGPNVVALPYHDTVNNESFVLLQALKDIKKDDQLLLSYGAKLSNSHLIQKYGFTLPNNSANNAVSLMLPYHDYQAVVNEESELK